MNKTTIIIIILVILAIFSFAFYSYLTDKTIDDYLKMGKFADLDSGDTKNSDNLNELNNIEGGASGGESGGSGGGGSGGTGSSGGSGTEEELPDIEGSPCGFYFKEYGVCGGTCPSGTCGSEGRSCYCKK